MSTFPSEQAALREEIVVTCRRLAARGHNPGTSGNVSARLPGGGFLLTPTSTAYDAMRPEDIVEVTPSGACLGARRPSSELPFHRAILDARPEVGAVVHTHSTHATAVSCLRLRIPAVHYQVALFGGSDIPCAAYALFGTEELSARVVEALEGRRATLLANHGLIVVGDNLRHGLALAIEAEQLARLYLLTLGTGILPVILDDAQIAAAAAQFRALAYGAAAGGGSAG